MYKYLKPIHKRFGIKQHNCFVISDILLNHNSRPTAQRLKQPSQTKTLLYSTN